MVIDMAEISIEYCATCSQVGTATALRRLVLDELGEWVDHDGVSLWPHGEHTFRVRVDDEEVWAVDADEEHVDPRAALNAIRYRLRA
jgi:predicted Rdx family selenoprotein